MGWYLPGGPWAVSVDRIERAATAEDLTAAGLCPQDLTGLPRGAINEIIDIIEAATRHTVQRLSNTKGHDDD